MNILFSEAVFITIFNKSFAGINHKKPFLIVRKFFCYLSVFHIQHNDTGRNTRAIKQIGRQSNNSFNAPFFKNVFTNFSFHVSSKQDPMRQDTRPFSRTFQRFNDVEKKGIIAIFFWWKILRFKTPKWVFGWIKTVHPIFRRKWRIGNNKVECFEVSRFFIKVQRVRNCALSFFNNSFGAIVENHIHPSQGSRNDRFLLSVNINFGFGFFGNLQ